jgi:hypothetical protein
MADEFQVELKVDWTGIEDVPLLVANQFVVQFHEGAFVLSLGQVTPPVLVGTPEQRKADAQDLESVPVKGVARVYLTRQRLEELVQGLQSTLDAAPRTKAEGET